MILSGFKKNLPSKMCNNMESLYLKKWQVMPDFRTKPALR